MTGATMTPTGTPRLRQGFHRRQTCRGEEARGSNLRASSLSREVIESITIAAWGREFLQQVQIPRHQEVLGDDADRVAELGQDGQAARVSCSFRSMGW